MYLLIFKMKNCPDSYHLFEAMDNLIRMKKELTEASQKYNVEFSFDVKELNFEG